MNFIKKLQQDKDLLEHNINDVQEQITAAMVYLSSSKFAGHENNYINAGEVLDMFTELRIALMNTEKK